MTVLIIFRNFTDNLYDRIIKNIISTAVYDRTKTILTHI